MSMVGMGVGWQGGPRERGYMCTHSWFSSLYSRNEHNIVKQLYSNLKKEKKEAEATNWIFKELKELLEWRRTRTRYNEMSTEVESLPKKSAMEPSCKHIFDLAPSPFMTLLFKIRTLLHLLTLFLSSFQPHLKNKKKANIFLERKWMRKNRRI